MSYISFVKLISKFVLFLILLQMKLFLTFILKLFLSVYRNIIDFLTINPSSATLLNLFIQIFLVSFLVDSLYRIIYKIICR